MSNSKAEKEKLQLIQEKSQQILSELLKDEDNKYCVDCDAKGPRWASWNIGVFLCIRCAGIHRNMGVHISRVKSVNLDSWSPEQVGHMQLMGNSKARAVYEANLPDNFKRPHDTGLEQFVRAKYETKKYIAKEWVQPPAPKPAFDIEEERKKDKEKKRSKIIKGQTNSAIIEVQTNPVPRPHSSPASGAINAEKVLNKNGSKPSNDLLGLSSSNATPSIKSNSSSVTDDDQFDAFVSCAPIAPAKPQDDLVNVTPANKTNEEEDFFNQKAPEQKKLDKESILKLYETSSNLNQPQANLFNLNSTATLTPLQPTMNGFNTNLIANGTQPLNPMQPTPQLNNQAANLFATTGAAQVNNGFANFNNQPANLNQQPFLAFNQNANANLANPLPTNQQSTNPFLNASSTNGTSATLTSTDLFSSINTNLSTTTKLEAQMNGLNLANSSNDVSVGQSLFSANFDTNLDKKVNGNGLNSVSIANVSPANPFLTNNALGLQPTQQVQPQVQTTPNLDILSSFSTTTTNNLNGLSKNANDLDDLENWSNFHTATTTTNNATLTADTLWQ